MPALWAAAGSHPTPTDTEDALRVLLAHDPVGVLLAHDPDALLLAELAGELAGTLIAGWDGPAFAFWAALGYTREHHRARIVSDLPPCGP